MNNILQYVYKLYKKRLIPFWIHAFQRIIKKKKTVVFIATFIIRATFNEGQEKKQLFKNEKFYGF